MYLCVYVCIIQGAQRYDVPCTLVSAYIRISVKVCLTAGACWHAVLLFIIKAEDRFTLASSDLEARSH